jgi:hypothetical protein
MALNVIVTSYQLLYLLGEMTYLASGPIRLIEQYAKLFLLAKAFLHRRLRSGTCGKAKISLNKNYLSSR